MEKKHEQMLESTKAKGMMLAERWSEMPKEKIRGFEDSKRDKIDFLAGLEEDNDRAFLAQLLENAYNGWLNRLDESTRSLHVGSFEKFIFPLIRALYANLVVKDLVTVHPLDAPHGLVFYMDALYGSNKGDVARGTRTFDARTGPAHDFHYTDEVIENESVGTGNGATAQYTPTLAYTPIRAGTVEITDGTQTVVDNGNGALEGDVAGGGNNTINYSTGAVDVTFAANVGDGDAIVASYEMDMEANQNLPQLDIQLTSAPVQARPNKLISYWSVEAQQDLQAYHGRNAEVEIVGYMTNQIAREINEKIIRHLRNIANAGTVTWDRSPPAGVQWLLHKETFYDALIQLSNSIFSRTQRMNGNWLVAGVEVCNVIETLSRFTEQNVGTEVAGIRKIGTLGRFDVYKDPAYPTDEFLMGYKGDSFLDTGYIWAPYQLLYTTPTVVLEDMRYRKGMMQRTGTKVVNSLFYGTGTVVQTGAAF